ncbi:MAG TPA: bile acid:sodium symporter [Methylomirabilota bacterium]|nr:bile acid:sodium symporter [Methylomirabilota bacterium]
MSPVADAAVPVVIFLMMTAVGHGLTPSELRRSVVDLRAVASATIGQVVLLPLAATVVALLVEPPPSVTAGLVLVAACPGGTISNFYAHLARANTALSVTLTAASCLLAFVTIPALVSGGFYFWLDDVPRIEVPPAALSLQLLVLGALPIILGMVLRAWRPAGVVVRDRLLRQCSLAGLVALVAYVVTVQWGALVADLPVLVAVAVLFTALAMAAGLGLAWVTGRPAADRLTYLIEFPCRNLSLAVAVALTVLHRSELLAFAVILLLVQALVMLTLVALLRRDAEHRSTGERES